MSTAPPGLADGLRERYVLQRELGAGGMATVYLAEDLKHHRKVALKVLRPELAAVIGGQRFLNEIETTANLQHPHILPLHDSGEVSGTVFYVMPHVEGESLRDRLAREKQLPIADAVRIATEVASALDYAHRKGVIHRDIKPENILLHEGQALVADFGIALAATAAGGSRMTETGMSLGTPHYMSPEQAMGEREITARSDVYALGAVLYEMLTGDPPFTGSTAQAIVAKVVTEAPRPLIAQRHTIPPHLEAAVLTALEKLPADRFASAAEFAQSLTATGARTMVTAARPAPVRSPTPLAWAAAAVLGLLLLGASVYQWRREPAVRSLSASLLPPPGCAYVSVGTSNLLQLSPDGRTLAFTAGCDEDESIWIRSMETGENRRLPGTGGGIYPFWSPDGRSLGFFEGERLKRIDLESGAVRDLAPASDGRGGSWNRDGLILYAPDIFGPLYQVAASGGEPKQATAPPDSGDVSHRLPLFLPDGRHFLYSEGNRTGAAGRLLVGELGSRDRRQLLGVPSNVAYGEGMLLYVRDGVLLAQPFSPGSATLSGNPVALAPSLETWAFRYLGNFSISAGRRLVYRPAVLSEGRVEWLDPVTGGRAAILDRGAYRFIRLSPDGRRLLVSRAEGQGALSSVWLYEPAQGAWSRISSEAKIQYQFSFSRDGRQVILQPVNDTGITRVSLDGGRVDTLPGEVGALPVGDWAPDGSYSVGSRQVRATGWDLLRGPAEGRKDPPAPLYVTPADELFPRVSPDGRYVSYLSNQSGRYELYVARLPGATGHVQVSTTGATFVCPVWARSGRVLYYIGSEGKLFGVPVATAPELRLGRPAEVTSAPADIASIDAAPDGRLAVLYADRTNEVPVTLIENWPALLRGR